MIGVYKIKNRVNGKIYIGASTNIENRFKQHIYTAYKGDPSTQYMIHHAIRKHGKENFEFSVVEEVSNPSKLYEREKFWVNYYNSYVNGYNLTLGGEGFGTLENPKALLSENDVINLRLAYKNKTYRTPREAMENLFPELDIHFKSFSRIFHGERYSDIMPEVFTKELKEYYKKQTRESQRKIGSSHGRTVSSEEEVFKLRVLRLAMSPSRILTIINSYSSSGLSHILGGRRYKHVPYFNYNETKLFITEGYLIEETLLKIENILLEHQEDIEAGIIEDTRLGKLVAKIDPQTNKVIKVYQSLKDAERDTGEVTNSGISKYLKGERKETYAKFLWREPTANELINDILLKLRADLGGE